MKTKLILIGIIATFVLISFFSIKSYISERKERKRLESNQNELLSKNNDLQLYLKKKELQIVIDRDSFLRSKNIMAKRINELSKIGMRLRIDTVLDLQLIQVPGKNDTIIKYVRQSIYYDGWNFILNQIEEDSIRNTISVTDSLYLIDQWYRKWFLGKRIDDFKLLNRNPKAEYNIVYKIKKVKK